jgi:hypothetical protein
MFAIYINSSEFPLAFSGKKNADIGMTRFTGTVYNTPITAIFSVSDLGYFSRQRGSFFSICFLRFSVKV